MDKLSSDQALEVLCMAASFQAEPERKGCWASRDAKDCRSRMRWPLQPVATQLQPKAAHELADPELPSCSSRGARNLAFVRNTFVFQNGGGESSHFASFMGTEQKAHVSFISSGVPQVPGDPKESVHLKSHRNTSSAPYILSPETLPCCRKATF